MCSAFRDFDQVSQFDQVGRDSEMPVIIGDLLPQQVDAMIGPFKAFRGDFSATILTLLGERPTSGSVAFCKGRGPMTSNCVIFATMIAVTVSGCSSRPREFTPMLSAPPISSAAFDASYAECSQLLVAGKLDKDGRGASGAGGAAAGAGFAAAGAATAASVGAYGGLAIAAATVVLLPFAVVGGAWGMSKMKRAKKENAIKIAMSGCLKERGHEVMGWAKAGKKAKNAGTKVPSASPR